MEMSEELLELSEQLITLIDNVQLETPKLCDFVQCVSEQKIKDIDEVISQTDNVRREAEDLLLESEASNVLEFGKGETVEKFTQIKEIGDTLFDALKEISSLNELNPDLGNEAEEYQQISEEQEYIKIILRNMNSILDDNDFISEFGKQVKKEEIYDNPESPVQYPILPIITVANCGDNNSSGRSEDLTLAFSKSHLIASSPISEANSSDSEQIL